MEELCYTSLQTKTASWLSCCLKCCWQAAGAGQEPTGGLPGAVRGGSAGPVVGLQPLRGTRPSQPASSLDSGSAHPAASTRGHCYTKEEEEEEEERDKFRKHCSLEVLFPGVRTLGKCVWSATISVEVHKRKGVATGSFRDWFISTSDITDRDYKVTPLPKPSSLHHVKLEEQQIPCSWGDIWGREGEMSYATALQRQSNVCYNNNEAIFTNVCMKFAASNLDLKKACVPESLFVFCSDTSWSPNIYAYIYIYT